MSATIATEWRPDHSPAAAAIRQRLAVGLPPHRCAGCGEQLRELGRVFAVRTPEVQGHAALCPSCTEPRELAHVLVVAGRQP